MANEAQIRDRIGEPLDFTVADGTGIEKGACLTLSTARTAATVSGFGGVIAGIAAREKVASDGRTKLAVWRTGVFSMTASGAIIVGEPVGLFSENKVGAIHVISNYATGASGAAVLGYALESITNGAIQIMVNVGAGGAAGAG